MFMDTKKITELSTASWILLSRGIGFEKYQKALTIAMQNGAKGFAVGRSVWKEVGEQETFEQQQTFIQTIARKRMEALIQIVESV